MRRLSRILLAALAIVCVLAMAVAPVAAQAETPIAVGENKTGALSAEAPSAAYVLTVEDPQLISLQVLSITAGYAPVLRVVDANGITVRVLDNPNNLSVVQGNVALTTSGEVRLVVTSAGGTFGQFLISVQGGPALPDPVTLGVGQVVNGTVSAEQPIALYMFGVTTDVLGLVVRSSDVSGQTPVTGPNILLRDAQTGEVLASVSSSLTGGRFRLPPGDAAIMVEIAHANPIAADQFTICLENETRGQICPNGVAQVVPTQPPPTAIVIQPTFTPIIPTATPFVPVSIPPNGPCAVATSRNQAVNVRSGPGLNFNIIGQLAPSGLGFVIQRLPDASWYQANVNGVIGWVSATVIITGGLCGVIPVATVPPTAIIIPTLTPTPIVSTTPTPTLTITPQATLNFSLPAVFGSTALTSGFVPDPFTISLTAGGPANVAYLGGGCSGFTTSAPSFSVNYTAGAFPLLRFYFVGAGDTTMIINSPSGAYTCVDDSFGTLNPTIDFNSPATGRYDVWIGTFSSGGSVGGTLFVTENSANRP
jgi:uncharacterized protein YraI